MFDKGSEVVNADSLLQYISSDTDSQDIAIQTGRYGESKHDAA